MNGSETWVRSVGVTFAILAALGLVNALIPDHHDAPRPVAGWLDRLRDSLPWSGIAVASAQPPETQPMTEMIQEGARLFFTETFAGNGRTCATCHPAESNFTLDPDFIASLPPDDPLFVAENNAALATLENPALMRGSRALILENIDGFGRPPVFRGTPHIFNVALTAPFGLSGEIATLADFALAAVVQHFPRSLNRIPGVDFRVPTQEELDAMEAFMLSVFTPPDQNFDLDRLITTPQEQSGRDLFFGEAKCFQCHGGPVLAEADPALGGGNQAFNTGVVNLPQNTAPPPECPTCPPLGPLEAGGMRTFSTPPLVGIARTAPFFHDNSVATLREAVAFYDGIQFNQSPAALVVGSISLTASQIDDITAFLEALTPCGNGQLDAGEVCDDGAANGRNGCCSTVCRLVDGDADLACDAEDNCRTMANDDQSDVDGDGAGDLCDDDDGPGSFALRSMRMRSHATGAGSLRVNALLDDGVGTDPIGDQLLTGQVVMQVADSGRFSTAIRITGCRPGPRRDEIICRSADARVQARLRTVASGAFTHALTVVGQRLVGASLPGIALAAPVQVTLHQERAIDRRATGDDCLARGRARLVCRDDGSIQRLRHAALQRRPQTQRDDHT